MGEDGLARLVVSLMVAGGVAVVDAAMPLYVHAAVLSAVESPGGDMLLRIFGIEVHSVPDPSVGLRVRGLTQALWAAVGRGWLEARGGDGRALLVLSDAAARDFAVGLSQFDEVQSRAVRHAGDVWAASSTSLKNSVNPFVSSAFV
jgi:hypothetical protein